MAIVGMFGLFFRFLGFGRSTFLDHDLKKTHTTPQRPQHRAAALEGAEIDSIDIGNDIELIHALKKTHGITVAKIHGNTHLVLGPGGVHFTLFIGRWEDRIFIEMCWEKGNCGGQTCGYVHKHKTKQDNLPTTS